MASTPQIPPVSLHDAMFMPDLGFAPMPAVARVLARFDRPHLEAFMEVAVDLLDLMDGDDDVEPNGDELDGTGGEDDFWQAQGVEYMAGCPLSDPGEDDDSDKAVDDDPIDGGDDDERE